MCHSQSMKTSVAQFRRPEELWEDLLAEEKECLQLNAANWALTRVNVEDTRVQTLQDELQRLQVLQSYNSAGVHGVPSIDRLVHMGTSIFNMPLCVVSLVDLRRLWFLSSQGFGDLREIPRKDALCSHAVCNVNGILIVQDCEQDDRFRELSTVTGPPNLRFYAGACITSPEGYNIGNFCVLDTKPHPEGLTQTQIQILKDFAATTMQLLVDRRYRQEMETKQKPLIANTAHELMTPLAGINVSLTALHDDPNLVLDEGQQEMLQLASSCSNLMTRICRNMIDTVRSSSSSSSSGGSTTSSESGNENNIVGDLVRVSDLMASLNQIIRPIPKRVPVLFQVDSEAALASVKDELTVFRVTLAFLSIACARTQQGSIVLNVQFQQDGSLLFECQDTAETISVMDQQALFYSANDSNDGSLVPSVAAAAAAAAAGSLPALSDTRLMGYHSGTTLLESLGGNYGHRPNEPQQGGVGVNRNSNKGGSVFWFSIPKPLVKCPKSFTSKPLEQLQSNTNRKRESKTKSSPNRPLDLKRSELGVITKNRNQGEPDNTKTKLATMIPLMSRRSGSLPTNLHFHASSRYGNNSITPVIPEKNATFYTTTRPLLSPIWNISMNRSDDIIPRNGTKEQDHSIGAVVKAPATKSHRPEVSKVVTPTLREGALESEKEKVQSWNNKALVIDDSLVIRKGLSRLLTKNGHQVETAVDGQQGLEAMKKTMFDFVLCDFLMPVMDGLDCVKQFREWEQKHRPGFYQCIFGISAHADTKDLEKGIQLGMDQYFTKPIPLQVVNDLPNSARAVRTEKTTQNAMVRVDPPPTSTRTFSSLQSPHSSCNKLGSKGIPPTSAGPEQRTPTPGQHDSGRSNEPSSRLLQSSSSLFGANDDNRRSCLVASSESSSSIGPLNDKGKGSIQEALEDQGWRCVPVHTSDDALRYLKERNWDAVIVDSHLAPLRGVETIAAFRQWEQTSRMNRQSNVFLEFSLDGGNLVFNNNDNDADGYRRDAPSYIQAPPGFDGVIQRERLLEDFGCQVKTENDHDRHSGVGSLLSIITH